MRRPARRCARIRRARSRRGPPARRPSTSRAGCSSAFSPRTPGGRSSTRSTARRPRRSPRVSPTPRGGRVPEALDQLFLEFQTAVAGRYSLERELGRGGMGVVYLAREVSLDRPVAIKVLPPWLAREPGLRERFVREARTAAQLSHPNIVPIHTVDDAAGLVFFAMAYLDGETLGERVRTRGPLPPDECARILREIAWALGYAHAQGVIHRDLKPDNIMLERAAARAVLTDFGIARRLETTGLTAAGELVGTPEFMSPEQATGGALDGRADLYALGVVAFYALAGRLPFEASTVPAMLIKQATEPAPPLSRHAPTAPRALAQAVMRCLEKNPADRFADAGSFAAALSVALEARREVPAAVRVFVKNSLELKAGGCLYVILALYTGPGLLTALLFGAGMRWGVGLGLAVSYFLALAVVPLAAQVSRIRRLLRQGFGHADVMAGIREESARRREELAVEVGQKRSPIEQALRVFRWPAFAAGVAGLVARVFGAGFTRLSPLIWLATSGGFVVWMLSGILTQRRTDAVGKRRLKYWGGCFGSRGWPSSPARARAERLTAPPSWPSPSPRRISTPSCRSRFRRRSPAFPRCSSGWSGRPAPSGDRSTDWSSRSLTPGSTPRAGP